MNEIPEPWAAAMVAAGCVDGRATVNPRPSARALADAVNVHTSTITRMISGNAVTDHATVEAVAKVLDRPVTIVSEWVSQARSVDRRWEPPTAVHQLTRREQVALTELINAMVAAREESGGDVEQAAPIGGDSATYAETDPPPEDQLLDPGASDQRRPARRRRGRP